MRKVAASSRRSTLTSSEREIFARLTGEDSGDSRANNNSKHSHSNNITPEHKKLALNIQETTEITSIFDSAVQNINKEAPSTISAGSSKQEESGSADQPPYSLADSRDGYSELTQASKIFSKLRAFRDSNYGSSSPENEEFAGIHPFPLARLISKREAKKIYKELDDAIAEGKGDIGVWEICERKIFGMLQMVDLEALSPLAELRSNGGWQHDKFTPKSIIEFPNNSYNDINASKKFNGKDAPLDIPEHVPIVPVVMKTYPYTLLYAAKLLCRHFPMSQYNIQFLDAVKARGRASFLIGASTQLCNELIAFRWHVYSDLPYIVSLLKDMEEAGIEFDRRTLSLVDEIRKSRQVDRDHSGVEGGDDEDGSWWWDSETTRTSYKNLVGWGRGKGWITRIRAQLKKNQIREKKAEELSKKFL
ncbi:hypothetical protein LOZ66_002437 [Ophidiomyces ophidiicola]|nr:hypothetical protein LOZ66_002437 [Ophidiomyces ophidiicola]